MLRQRVTRSPGGSLPGPRHPRYEVVDARPGALGVVHEEVRREHLEPLVRAPALLVDQVIRGYHVSLAIPQALLVQQAGECHHVGPRVVPDDLQSAPVPIVPVCVAPLAVWEPIQVLQWI